MKKLLGIMVLGFLLSGNAYAASYKITYINYYDKSVVGRATGKNEKVTIQNALSKCQKKSKIKNLKPEGCLRHDYEKSSIFILDPREVTVWNKSVEKFEKTLKPEEIVKDAKHKTKEQINVEKEKIELAKIIEKAKATCETLGFEKGADKFSDCTLKLYTQEVDNKVALKVAKQNSSLGSSNSGTMVIYDPVRDRQNKIDKGMEMITGRCTLGNDC